MAIQVPVSNVASNAKMDTMERVQATHLNAGSKASLENRSTANGLAWQCVSAECAASLQISTRQPQRSRTSGIHTRLPTSARRGTALTRVQMDQRRSMSLAELMVSLKKK